ncbi:hypothetical protein LCGC14_2575990 [marine sediment metagenome]|uniref:Uncharacterized protein n=1 Tax=marine sediment metagenome TaxID=412755 RepID=A0A0F9AG92_9ZZZZ
MKSRHFKTKLTPEHVEQINQLCKVLERYSKLSGTGLKFRSYQWVQHQVNNNSHPLAIIDGLTAVIKKWFDHKDPMRSAYTYANGVVKTKSGTYREAEHVKESQEFRAKWKETIKNERLKGLASGIG